MSVYSLELTINARDLAAKAFPAVKRFDNSVVMGAALQQMREGKPFEILLDCPNCEGVLIRLIELLDELGRLRVSHAMSVNNVPRSSHLWKPRDWTRADVVTAVETLRQNARTADDRRRRAEEWLNSPDGRKYVATSERLGRIRDLLQSRWGALGFENLRPSEKDYLYIWWLCVEVENGTFHQYFFNSAGDTALLALSALRSLGAASAHSILSEALSRFESVGGFKPHREERWMRLNALPDEAFDGTTRRFYELTEDIRSLALRGVERDYERNGIATETAM